jgi:uncharacterized protein
VKYLLVLLVVAIGAWVLFGRASKRGTVEGKKSRKAAIGAEEMVACVHCGVHLPRGDALVSGGDLYCSEAHRVAGPRA